MKRLSLKNRVSIPALLRIQGFLLLIEGAFMLSVLPVTYFHHGINAYSMPFSALITFLTGFILCFSTRRHKGETISPRDGVITISLSWVILSIFGGLPLLLSKSVPNFTDAFFETLSGFTTTGATILTKVETVPKDIMLWRCMTQWLGGFAIIVFAVAILPYLSVGGMQLFMAEMNGITNDKLHPRTIHTAKRLWAIYIVFTVMQMLLLWAGDMDWYDALCHSMTTISSGGFSTRTNSITSFSSYSQIVILFFMALSGCNFTLLLLSVVKGPMVLLRNEEFKHYIFTILIVSLGIAVSLFVGEKTTVGNSLQDSFFSVISTITTTGFYVCDYTLWPTALWILLLCLMFIGSCSGSTSGGIKIIRHLVFVKNAGLEMKRTMHPNAVLPVKINGKSISKSMNYKTMTFIFVYFIIFLIGFIILRSMGLDFNSSIGASLATLSNIGTGVGVVGPYGTYAFMPQTVKWILCFFMLLGRVELFTLLTLFSRNFWRR